MLDAVNGLAPSRILVVDLVLLMLLIADEICGGASWQDRVDNRTDSLKEDPSKNGVNARMSV